MKLAIAPAVFQSVHEQFLAGLIEVRGLSNRGSAAEIDEMLRDIEELVRLSFSPESVQTHQLLSAWKAAVAHLGEAKHYESNVERLMSYVLHGRGVASRNKLADLCTFLALKYLIPIAALDLAQAHGNLAWKLSTGRETLAVDGKSARIPKGDLIFSDRKNVLAWKLDYQTNPVADASTATKDALISIVVVPPVTQERLQSHLDELAGLIRIFCGGSVQKAILSRERRTVEL